MKFGWHERESASSIQHAKRTDMVHTVRHEIWIHESCMLIFKSSINRQMLIYDWLRTCGYPRLINRPNLISINNNLKIVHAMKKAVHRFPNYNIHRNFVKFKSCSRFTDCCKPNTEYKVEWFWFDGNFSFHATISVFKLLFYGHITKRWNYSTVKLFSKYGVFE